jgi:hypothetical protein
MTRTKWMRLGVRDMGDILRWAGEQNAGQLDAFRHRVIRGREFVSFRMVPRYAIEIGTADIIVVAHVAPSLRQRAVIARQMLVRHAARLAKAFRPAAVPAISHTAEIYTFQPPRLLSQQ